MSHSSYRNRESLAGYFFVLGATIIWSGNFIVARGLSDSIPPVTLAFLRWTTAVVVMLPFCLRALWRERTTIKGNLGYLSLTAFLGVTLFNTLVYMAGRTSPALNMSLIATFSPVFVVILARFLFKEPITAWRVVGLVTATVGVALLVTDGKLSLLLNMTFTEGDLWMLPAAAIFAGYSILVRRKPGELGQGAFLGAIFMIGLVFLLPWTIWEQWGSRGVTFSATAVLAILYLGVGPSLLAFLCWNRAIALIGPARASFVYYSLPVFSGIEASLILREPIDLVHVFSGALILIGIITATLESNNKTIHPRSARR
jgi:drug/metabolite transporter (DMT)-like permease